MEQNNHQKKSTSDNSTVATSEEVLHQKVCTHEAICAKLGVIYEQKNHDYNDAFHKRFMKRGMTYAVDKMQEKLDRIEALSQDGNTNAVEDEPLADSLLDLANYALMTIIELGGPESWRQFANMKDQD